MRPLTEPETKALFSKLANYLGRSLERLIAPVDENSEKYAIIFTFYVWEGKFTKTTKFRLHITALPILAQHASHKIWVKANGEMPFLYGGHVLKAHIGRWSEDCAEHQGVVVYSLQDMPLGFGITARSTAEARRLEPTSVAAFRQADCGEYLRDEDTLFA